MKNMPVCLYPFVSRTTRCMLICVGLVQGALKGAEAAGARSTPATQGRPNILFILADNWAYPHASILGDKTVKTPAFDRLAREGVLFRNCFNASPSCSPTRASILTGRPPHQLEEAGNLWGGFSGSHRVVTQMLRESGYGVGYSGKPWAPGNYTLHGWKENPVGREFVNFQGFLDHAEAGKPFFFWLGNTDTATRPQFKGWRYDEAPNPELNHETIQVPPELPDTPEIRRDILAYYSGVLRLDRVIGEALAALEKKGILDQTVVVCTGDNGWQMPRGLANCYDSGSHVPLAIRWGNRLEAGRSVDAFVISTDFTATFLELAGLQPNPEMTSRSFLDLLMGKIGTENRDAVYIERERHANVRSGNLSYPMRAIRTKDYLYILNSRPDRWPAGDPELHFDVGPYGDVDACQAKNYLLTHAGQPEFKTYFNRIFGKRPAEELYDLTKDPGQINNVAGQAAYAQTQGELRARLNQWMTETKDPRLDPAYDMWDHYPYYAPGVLGKAMGERMGH